MIIFLDTNILVELIERRNNSDKVFVILDKCRELGNCLYMSVGGFYTITYLVDRHLKQEGKNNPERLQELKSILKYILSICNISSLDKEGICLALITMILLIWRTVISSSLLCIVGLICCSLLIKRILFMRIRL